MPQCRIPSISTCGTSILTLSDEDVFAEPWQARAFALAMKLSEQGYFTREEWTTTLAGELKAVVDRGETDDDLVRVSKDADKA